MVLEVALSVVAVGVVDVTVIIVPDVDVTVVPVVNVVERVLVVKVLLSDV